MTASVWQLLAQGAVDALNLRTFAPEAEAKRGWRIYHQVADTEQPTITVVPTAKSVTNGARGKKIIKASLSITVGRQHSGTSGETDPVEREDEIAGLAQQVEDYLADPASKIAINVPESSDGAGDAEVWDATPTGDVAAEVIQEWLADGVFAVLFTIEYTIFR